MMRSSEVTRGNPKTLADAAKNRSAGSECGKWIVESASSTSKVSGASLSGIVVIALVTQVEKPSGFSGGLCGAATAFPIC
jgi:hypothetical protein